MKLFRKLNLNDHNNSGSPVSDDVMSPLGRPTQTDITRYRYHNGTNLGSIYVLEKWIFPKMFSNPPVMAKDIGAREIDAVQASIKAVGLEATKKRWELHWQKAVLPADWTWLKDVARCTSIRLPIGYYTLSQEFCKGTPFEGDTWEIYANAWQSVKTLVKTASAHGIGVLLDLHALPGGANKDAHSGSGTASLWINESNRIMARRCATFLAQEVTRDEEFAKGVIGIQLVNEAKWKAERMYDWYDSVIDSISKIQPDLPIYISDAWDLPSAINYARKKNISGIQNCRKKGPVNPVVVDTHKYYCFNETHKAMHPLEVINNKVPSDFGNFDLSGPTSIVIGEWSCVLSETAWCKVSKDERVAMTSSFGQQQSLRWYETTGGSYFWTWKLGWMPGGSWGFSKQINDGNLFIPPGLQLSRPDIVARIASAQHSRPTSLSTACKSYLDRHSDVEGYTSGWNQGFEDSITFFDSGGHVIGLFGAWVMKRMTDAGGERPQSWIDGFERGVGDFRKLVMV